MIVLLVVLALVVVLVGGGAAALALRSKQDYDASNEVVPGIRSRAPSAWAGAHSTEALLHRRLRSAVLASHAAATAGLGDARGTIEQTALAIDDRLIAAAALPHGHREPALAGITRAVEELEEAVASMSALPAGAAERPALEQAIDEVRARLAALEQARAEVQRLDDQPGSSGTATPG